MHSQTTVSVCTHIYTSLSHYTDSLDVRMYDMFDIAKIGYILMLNRFYSNATTLSLSV